MASTHEDMLFDKKDLAVDLLNNVLRVVGDKGLEWKHRATLGYNTVILDPELEIVKPRYGKVTEFNYVTLVVKDGEYTIIMYHQPASNSFGYGVLSEEGDVCLEITTYDLVDWFLPIPSGRYEKERLEFLDELVHEAQKLIE